MIKTAAFWLSLAMCVGAFSQTAPRIAKIGALQPNTVERGRATGITVTGEFLRGVTAVHVTGEKITTSLEAPAADGKSITLKVAAAVDAVPGDREVRLISPEGVSNPLLLNISPIPVALETEPNNTLDKAQKIDLPARITGRIHAEAERDGFAFSAKKGQFLIFNLYALRIDSKLDSLLILQDANGSELARNDDAVGSDSLLEYAVPEDGTYFVFVQDSQWRGGDEFVYRLDAGPLPFIESAFPLGGPRGRSVDVRLTGRNLQGMEKIRIDVEPAAAAALREIRAETAPGVSNPRLFDVSDLPEVMEQETVPVPGVVNGRVGRPGETDTFRFNPGTHARLVFEVVAARCGSPLDSVLAVRDAAGKILESNDDVSGGDARVDYKAFEANREYAVSVHDLMKRGGERFAYRLYIHPPRPSSRDFTVRFQPDVVIVNRGSHAKVWWEITRRAGFEGDVILELAGLPPGLSAEPVTAAGSGPPNAVFTMAASAEAPLGSFPIRLTARAGENPSVEGPVSPEREGRAVAQGFVTVGDAPLFTIEPVGADSAEEEKRQARIAELEKVLNTPTPELDAAQAEWERSALTPAEWIVLVPETLKSSDGSTLTKLEDGSIRASGESPNRDTYTVIVKTPLTGITAFRLDALADDTLPAGGPGRVFDGTANGNFLLTEFFVQAAPVADGSREIPVDLREAAADFSQNGRISQGAIDGVAETGWAIFPEVGKPHTAVFRTRAPIGFEGGTLLTFTLDQRSPVINVLENRPKYQRHTLGRFRLSVAKEGGAWREAALPPAIRTILAVPREQRAADQKKELAAYYRSIAPFLRCTRKLLARLKAEAAAFPPVMQKAPAVAVGFRVRRQKGFNGVIRVSLDGYTTGRNGRSFEPFPLWRVLEVEPVFLSGDEAYGVLRAELVPTIFNVQKAQPGTRPAVLRADARVNGQAYTQYSRAFPLATIETTNP